MGATHTPQGMVFQMATDGTPRRLKEAMEAAGINTDRNYALGGIDVVDWADTVELRFVCDVDVQYTMLNSFYDDPATAIYTTIPAGEKYVVPINLAHEKVYFVSAAAGVLTAELFGAERPATPIK